MNSTISKKLLTTKTMVQIGLLSAAAIILMLFEIPLWFAPPFYKIDFSEVPVIVGALALGPIAGILIELVKIILNFLIDGTMTAGVGELANFVIGCSLVVPAAMIYKKNKTKKSAMIGLAVGTVFMTAIGCVLNAYLLLPAYATAFHLDIQKLIDMGTAINPNINSLWTFILLAVAPFNFIKGLLVSLVTLLIYKRISMILKNRI
ncbi:MAG: ECF transporter S component [Clostridiales bacterium]|nr:ECF transporter S component [Clostridiales bacterium]